MGGVSGKEGVGVQRVEEEEEEWATRRSSSRVDCVVCGEVEVGRGGWGRQEWGGEEGGGKGGGMNEEGREEGWMRREEVEVRRYGEEGKWRGR